MRRLIDSLTVLMLLCIVTGVVVYEHADRRRVNRTQALHRGLADFREQVALRGAIEYGQGQASGLYPQHIEPHWFDNGAPQNPLVQGDNPWLDIAPEDDESDQPPNPLITSSEQAAFWYNPNNGIIRARVPKQENQTLALKLYNEVNGTALTALPVDDDPLRQPVTFNPPPTSSGQLASLIGHTVGQVHTDQIASYSSSESAHGSPDPVPWWKQKPKPDTPSQPQPQPDAPKRPSLLSE